MKNAQSAQRKNLSDEPPATARSKQLVAFEALYSTRNLSRAAALVGFAQPTMSNLLTRLREAQNDQLFVRTPRGMQPTARAEEMIGSVRTILREAGAITHDDATFDPKQATREFRLHTIDLFESLLLPKLVADQLDCTGISFKMISGPTLSITEALENGVADLSLGLPCPNNPHLHWERLMPIRVVAIARKGHPGVSGPMTPEAFRQIGHVSLDFEPGAMANASLLVPTSRVQRRDVVRVTRIGSVIELVAKSDLAGVVPAIHLAASPYREQLQIVDVPLPEFRQQFQMTWHRRHEDDKSLKWLRSRILSILQEDWADYH